MKKLYILALLTSSVFAGGLEMQAGTKGDAKAIDIYWGKKIKSIDEGVKQCAAFAHAEYPSDTQLESLCTNSCVKNFKIILEKNERK